MHSVRIALGGFIVPYMFLFSHELLVHDATWLTGTIAFVTAVAGITMVAVAVVGYLDRKLNWWSRLVLAGGGLLLLNSEYFTDALGVAAGVAVLIWQRWTSARAERRSDEAAQMIT